ncbi:hypothetical protein LINPERPRIM_LOCUS13093 [Linum perenne]
MKVFGMTPPYIQMGEDSISWGLEPNNHFIVKSAYLLIKDINLGGQDSI